MDKLTPDGGKEPNSELEILQAQLEIAEATIISLKAEKAGLETRVRELETMLLENSTAQTVLSNAAKAIGEQLDDAMISSLSFPEGLSRQEELALITLRESMAEELKAKQENLKKYIRGEL